MKTFKEFLNEVDELSDVGKKGSGDIKPSTDSERILQTKKYKHISTMSSGHKVYGGNPGMGKDITEYAVVHPTSGKVEMALTANEHKGVLSYLELSSHKGNTIKAHDFYHHLITHHNKILVADSQSPGGHAVWKNLQRKHGKSVGIHGWNQGKPVNINMKDDEYTHGESWSISPEIRTAGNMKMVAHKK